MAQLVLGNLGAAVGARLLPNGLGVLGAQFGGAALGRAAGSILGAAVDARFLTPPVEGARVREFHLTESREGASVPIVHGRMRVGGQVIWAAQFKESRSVSGGGKGGPRTADYSYSLSFAVALCEGEVTQVTRCWANGEPLDLSRVTWRLYPGSETQSPDPLIVAIEGVAPAYRGVAYVVFEDLAVDAYGARMPQLSFEVVRPGSSGGQRLEELARGVNLIPGSGEFALATEIVRRVLAPGLETPGNAHASAALSDMQVSLDQLAAELPNLTRVNLVVAWFGDDLRCGECRIRPGVEDAGRQTLPVSWSVAGVARDAAYVVSRTEDRPNYGGTPSDASVMQAIIALKARGYHVTLYPFVLMDVPAGNGRPDPYGAAEQAAFPWRGRITCHPAPGQPGSPDGSADAAAQVEAFFAGGDGYRAFILHAAQLAADAGADGVLVGSEMIGLTRVRDAAGAYPAVAELRALAADVRAIVGSTVQISYAADWTEYGAHVRNGGADVSFPLDALWADDTIDCVGLDWYPPMGDWRDAETHADAAFGKAHALEYLTANIAGGEAFEWYYADEAGRAAQTRLPIMDGAYGEPFVFRPKDVAGWWGAAHHPRNAGVRSSTPTAWSPGMKPVRFVEFGCPAVDKGANQPNVFYDPKSSESALPHFSTRARDDLIQRRTIEAFCAYWADDANNPESGVYAGRMIPADGIGLWAWDARPFPAFPTLDDVWSDHGNWRLGHWLNGRAGAALLPDVVAGICARGGVDANVAGLDGQVTGYRFDGPLSVRDALEPLAVAYGFDAVERDGEIAFRMRGGVAVDFDVTDDVLAEVDGRAPVELSMAALELAEVGVRLCFIDVEADHAPGVAVSDGGGPGETVDIEAPVALDRIAAKLRANELAEDLTLQRTQARFALGPAGVVVEAGDVVTLADGGWRVIEVSDAGLIGVTACAAGPRRAPARAPADPVRPPPPSVLVRPDVAIVEAPPLPGQEDDHRPLAFAWSEPWVGAVIVSAGADASEMSVRGRIERPCVMGRLTTALYPHVSGRWQETFVWAKLGGGALASREDGAVLNGANTALIETAYGWEMMQFADAELVDAGTYRLSRLLRGQQGSEPEMAAGADVGARIVFLTGAEARLEAGDWTGDVDVQWTAWRRSPDEATAVTQAVDFTGRSARM